MILYWLENSAMIFLAVIFVLLFAPKTDRIEKPRTKCGTIGFYLLLAIPFSIGSAIFFSFYAIHEMASEINFPEIAGAMKWIAAFLILEFVADTLMIRRLTLFQAELFLNRSLGRVLLFFLSVFAGYFLIIFGVEWFVVPFLALKTMADIGAHVEMLTGYNDLEQKENPLTKDYAAEEKSRASKSSRKVVSNIYFRKKF